MPKTDKVRELPTRRPNEKERARSWVVYGRSGTGKTTFAGSFPGPHLYLDVKDDGTDSIMDADVEIMDIEDTDAFEEAYWFLKKNPKRYKTVTIDTVSQLQQIVVEEVAAQKKRRTKKAAGEWGSMTKQDWGEVASYLKLWLSNFRDLAREDGIEVIFIAQDRAFNLDDDEGQENVLSPEVGPRLSPSVASALNAMVSVIGNTFIRRRVETKKAEGGKKIRKEYTEYCLRLGPDPIYLTKLRKPKNIEAPAFIVDPEYDDVVDIIEGNYE